MPELISVFVAGSCDAEHKNRRFILSRCLGRERRLSAQSTAKAIWTPCGRDEMYDFSSENLNQGLRQYGLVDFTLLTYLYFLFPAPLRQTLANRPVYKPAKMPGVELPRRTILPFVGRTRPHQPARFAFFGSTVFQRKNQEELAFNMNRNISPALLKTLDGLRRNSQDLRHLVLSLV